MVFIRTFFRGFFLLIIALAAVAWILTMTLQATLLNRETVKGWIQDSGMYENLASSFIQPQQEIDSQSLIDTPTIETAIGQTFNAEYMQQQSETILDAFYDWAEGKKQDITFSIPINEKKDDFITNLAALLEPQFAEFPRCTSTTGLSNTRCLPPNYTAQSYAQQVANNAANTTSIFRQPLNQETTFASPSQSDNNLPSVVSSVQLNTWLLPVIIIVLSVACIFLTTNRLQGLAIVGRCLLFSGIPILIVGLIGWLFSDSLQSSTGAGQTSETFVQPLLLIAVPASALWMSIFSGTIVIVGAILWIIASTLRRNKGSVVASSYPSSTPPPIA